MPIQYTMVVQNLQTFLFIFSCFFAEKTFSPKFTNQSRHSVQKYRYLPARHEIKCPSNVIPFTPNKSLAEFAAKGANKIKSFLAATCAWTKILLRLQVWNLFAISKQIMRAADCKKWHKIPKGSYAKTKAPLNAVPFLSQAWGSSWAFRSP